MERIAKELVRLAREIQAEELTPKQKRYREFFEGMMAKYKVESPDELSEEEKKKFFDEVDKGWKAENEKK